MPIERETWEGLKEFGKILAESTAVAIPISMFGGALQYLILRHHGKQPTIGESEQTIDEAGESENLQQAEPIAQDNVIFSSSSDRTGNETP
jgi:hypothetical protein